MSFTPIHYKEIRGIISNKSTIVMGLAFALFFSIIYSIGIGRGENAAAAISLDSSLFYLPAAIGAFIAYVSVSQVFFREKMDKVIETLMCTPIRLRQIWLGKVVGVTAPAYSTSLLAAFLLIVISNLLSDPLLMPGVAALVQVLLVVPTFIAAFAGLVGFGQLLLGMCENRILHFLIFVPVFAALYGSGYAVMGGSAISWTHVGILFAISLVLLALTLYLARHLSKERIVTTLP